MDFKSTTMISFALFTLGNITCVNANEAISKFLTTIEQPKPIERIAPKYPKNAARNKREGWVQLSFVIEKDGSVSNVLVNESSGSKDFEKEAKKAALKWQYKPAIENGQPIQQCANSVQLDFRMNNNGEEKVTRKFLRTYKEASKALAEKNFTLVKEKLGVLDNFKYRHLSENNYYHLLSADYQKELGNQNEEFLHLSRTRFHKANDKLNVYNRQFWLAINLNLFKQAQSALERMKKLKEAEPYLDNYVKVMAKVESTISGDKEIVVSADIRNQEFWHYNLLRKAFSITNISGELHKLDVRCANKRHVYTIEENNTWTLPASWGNCDLFIYGDDDTRFNLIEHPIQS